MVLLTIILLISAGLLWVYDKSTLFVLGLRPERKRLEDFSFGLVSSALLGAMSFYLVALISGAELKFNPEFGVAAFGASSMWMVRSVLIEEFIFRGALLYVAIRKLGPKPACLLSAIAFGIYHWFSYDLIGNVPQMIYIFILTGVGGLLFAFSFAFTKSMYMPVGLHLGWNLVSVVVFSQGPLGDQWLIASGGQPIGAAWTAFFFAYQIIVLPLATFGWLRRRGNILLPVKS